MLAYADYSKPFRVHTDASEIRLGAILYQEQDDGTICVVAYASQSLSKSKKKYHSSKLEFLALKWAITEQFHEYLYGGTFKVHSDNNPLTYVLTTAKLDATSQRCVAALANYNFKIIYRSGKQNIDVDALSRIPWETEQVSTTLERGLCGVSYIPTKPITMMSLKPEILPKLTHQDWVKEQALDNDIHTVIQLLKKKYLPYKCKGSDSDELKAMVKFLKEMVSHNRILYQKIQLKGHDNPIKQFVMLKSFQLWTVQSMHNELGHLGMDRTLSLLQDRFFWYKMSKDVHKLIHSCERCLGFKTKPKKEELNPIETSYPKELVHLDYLTIGQNETDRSINILVVTDHFMKYAQAFIMPSQKAHVTAKVLWEQYLVHYGWPTKIISDQGRLFKSKLFKELCNIAKIQKL